MGWHSSDVDGQPLTLLEDEEFAAFESDRPRLHGALHYRNSVSIYAKKDT